MNLLKDIFIAIIGGILTAIVLYIYGRLSKRYRYWKTNKIMPLNGGVKIIVSSHQARFDFENFENEKLRIVVTAESVQGLSKLFKLYSRFNVEPIISVDKYNDPEQKTGIEICIGAPSANNRTKYYLENYVPNIFDEVGGMKTVLPNNARIIKITETLELERKVVFLIYGYYTSDTIIAIRCFSDDFHLLKRHLSHDFCSIFIQTSSDTGVNCKRIMNTSYDITKPIKCPNTSK